MTGNINPVRSPSGPHQLAMDNNACEVLIPTENRRSVMEVSSEVLERMDPILYGDAKGAEFTALGVA